MHRSVWFDLPVSNLADAMSFYEGLLGWTYRQMDDSTVSNYVMIEADGTLIGGLRVVASPSLAAPSPIGRGTARAQGEASGPILYFTVEKLTEKVARAKELGAQIVGQTVDLGKDRGRYQWIRDREGNLVGLWGLQ
jgi:predicted enzyme related to lactoylglutathione lyase